MGKPARSSFGPYQMVALLGEGGSGQVFRARDPRLERDVALKILHERSDSSRDRVRRFIAEARAASALNHPNIVTVFDAAIDGDTPFVVSELIDGRPLREEMERGGMPLKRVLELGVQIADGLAAAHEADIVHRDLKPENIMVTRSGRAKILDFGLARPGGFQTSPPWNPVLGEEKQTQTEMGLRAGTIPYMSPEQACGRTTDFRSDQFSFGLVLYEMLAGRPAFRGETPAATLDAIVNDEAPLAALPARTPTPLRWLIERCLAKDPEGRYGVTADLYRDLKTLRDRLGDLSSAESVPAVSRDRTLRRALFPIALATMALAVGAAIAKLFEESPAVNAAGLSFAPLATEAVYEGSGVWAPDGQTIAYVAEVNGTLQIFTRRLSAPASPAQVTDAPYDCKFPFWSPDSKRIYYVSLARDRDGLWSIGAAGGAPQVVVEDVARAALSPDGQTLAFLRDEQAGDIVGAQAVWLTRPGSAEPWPAGAAAQAAKRLESFGGARFVEGALVFSPDGRTLGVSVVTRSIEVAADARGWQFWLLELAGGAPTRRLQWLPDVAPRVNNFAWLPDSRHAIVSVTSLTTPGGDLWIADLAGDRAWPLTRGPDHESDPSAAPTGDAIVFSRDQSDYDLVEVSLVGGASRPLIETSRNESDPAWSSDGNLLAYVTDRSGRDEIWLRSREGDQIRDRPLITQDDFGDDQTIMLSSPIFSPDGRRIAYQRNSQKPIWPLRIWISLTAGGEPVPLLPPALEGYHSAPTWSPDGQWIAYTQWKDQEWMLAKVRVGSGEAPVVLRTDGVPNATPRWSPNNDWITWETARGFVLVSPDGTRDRALSEDQWLVHAWSHDGRAVIGVKDTEALRLVLVSLDSATGAARVLADLGPSPPANNPVRGVSLGPNGRAVATGVVRLRGDLWLLRGLDVRGRTSRFWPFRSP